MHWILLIAWMSGGTDVPKAISGSATQAAPLLLVLPIQGKCPPELVLPGVEHLVESILVELPPGPLGIRVEAGQPSGGRIGIGWIEGIKRRGRDLGAVAVMWAELLPPEDCVAVRRLGLRILALERDLLLERSLCPSAAEPLALARAMALATVLALKAGEVPSLPLRTRPETASETPVIAERLPEEAPPSVVPASLKIPSPRRSTWFLAAGGHFTSHPNWSSWGLGVEGALVWSPWAWLELGLGIEGLRGRRVNLGGVAALYSRWPIHLWAGGRLEVAEDWELLAQLGLELAWTRLDALLLDLQEVRTVDRFNPGLRARGGLRCWLTRRVGLELLIGSNVYLLRQRYVTGYYGRVDTVLSMQTLSFETSLRVVVPLD